MELNEMNVAEMELIEGKAMTDEALLQEAKSWGLNSVDEMMENIDQALVQADRDARSLNESGVLT